MYQYSSLNYTKAKRRRKTVKHGGLIFLVLLAVGGYFAWPSSSKAPQLSQQNQTQITPTPTPEPTKVVGFDKSVNSIDTPGSIWWIVNKKRALPDGYKPSDLVVPSVPLRLDASAEQMHIRSIASADVEALFNAAKQQGFGLEFASGFRSYEYQTQLYNSYVQKDGVAAADLYSARPGHSEHQTGLAFDIQLDNGVCELDICFGDTDAGKWLASHAHKYGFIIRYEQAKTSITGYQYEPWHLRYVGKDLAAELKKENITMEEFFGLDPAPTY